MKDFNSQLLADITTVSYASPELSESISEVATRCLTDFNSQHLAIIVRAFARTGRASPKMKDVANIRMKDLNSQLLADITIVSYATPELFESIAEVATLCLTDFNSQHLASIVRAFARTGRASPVLFDAITEVATRCQITRIKDFNSQLLADITTAGYASPELLESITEVATRCPIDFNSQHLANIVRAFAKDFNSHHRANIVWAFAKLGHALSALFVTMAQATHSRSQCCKDCQSHSLAKWLARFQFSTPREYGLGSSQAAHASLVPFDAIADCKYFKDCKFHTLANTAWAFAKVSYASPALLLCLLRKRKVA